MSGAVPLLPLCTNLYFTLAFFFPHRLTSSYSVTWRIHNFETEPRSRDGSFPPSRSGDFSFSVLFPLRFFRAFFSVVRQMPG